jgi:hypothetical protein
MKMISLLSLAAGLALAASILGLAFNCFAIPFYAASAAVMGATLILLDYGPRSVAQLSRISSYPSATPSSKERLPFAA